MYKSQTLFLSLIVLFQSLGAHAGNTNPASWTYTNGGQRFEWNLLSDKAKVVTMSGNATVWQGSLLPAFWLQSKSKKVYVKAIVAASDVSISGDSLSLLLRFGVYGTGNLTAVKEEWGVRFASFNVTWSKEIPSIISMYIGTSPVHPDSGLVTPAWEKPFMADWQSFGYCLPGAKGGTVQSYFRMWDFGQANIALGGFGPSLSAPYAAAYPRPLYYAAMGSDAGFAAIGAGSIPDAIMMLRIQASNGCFEYIYREDLWGAAKKKTRLWSEPLRITMGVNAYAAFEKYYQSFPSKKVTAASARSIWNTWGLWRERNYVIRPVADFAKGLGSEITVLDDPWESSQGSGKPSLERFPSFFEDLEYIRAQGMQPGIWETIGWISNPSESGLKNEDLLLQQNGKPCKANWNFSPWGESYYCLDISSKRTRDFIRERTIRIMKTVKPALIKLDFGYGFPDASVSVAKDPAYRGERFAFEMTKLIAEAAKSVNPEVIIMYYSISPLWIPAIDLVSMDDQGDLWYDIKAGHQQWSIWGSLIARNNMAVNGSSGYDWKTDEEVILNSFIIGSPGAVLPSTADGAPVPTLYRNRRLAINKWYRKAIAWKPLWINSYAGGFTAPPALRCWGRLESTGADSVLTALVLRDSLDATAREEKKLKDFSWMGRWAIVSQDAAGIEACASLAIIPFDAGWISMPCSQRPQTVKRVNLEGEKSFSGWTWENGMLNLKISRSELEETAGFLVERQAVR